jgi:hypothetical protein
MQGAEFKGVRETGYFHLPELPVRLRPHSRIAAHTHQVGAAPRCIQELWPQLVASTCGLNLWPQLNDCGLPARLYGRTSKRLG